MKVEKIIDISKTVLCDFCNEDYSDSDESGGFLFLRKAACPKCATRLRETVKKHNEERYIRGECREDESFAEFVHRVRNGNEEIVMYTE